MFIKIMDNFIAKSRDFNKVIKWSDDMEIVLHSGEIL